MTAGYSSPLTIQTSTHTLQLLEWLRLTTPSPGTSLTPSTMPLSNISLSLFNLSWSLFCESSSMSSLVFTLIPLLWSSFLCCRTKGYQNCAIVYKLFENFDARVKFVFIFKVWTDLLCWVQYIKSKQRSLYWRYRSYLPHYFPLPLIVHSPPHCSVRLCGPQGLYGGFVDRTSGRGYDPIGVCLVLRICWRMVEFFTSYWLRIHSL